MIPKVLSTLFLFFVLTIAGYAQTDWNLIDSDYDFFGARLDYSVKGKKLNFSQLKPILEKYPESNSYLEIAKRRKKVATPALLVGTAGLMASVIFRRDETFGQPLLWSSVGVFVVGATFQQGYYVNLHRSVNAYNKNLFRDGQAELKLKLSPTGTGLALVF